MRRFSLQWLAKHLTRKAIWAQTNKFWWPVQVPRNVCLERTLCCTIGDTSICQKLIYLLRKYVCLTLTLILILWEIFTFDFTMKGDLSTLIKKSNYTRMEFMKILYQTIHLFFRLRNQVLSNCFIFLMIQDDLQMSFMLSSLRYLMQKNA